MIISGNSKQSDQLYNKLKNQKPSKSVDESIKQRDKLLEYDRNGCVSQNYSYFKARP